MRKQNKHPSSSRFCLPSPPQRTIWRKLAFDSRRFNRYPFRYLLRSTLKLDLVALRSRKTEDNYAERIVIEVGRSGQTSVFLFDFDKQLPSVWSEPQK